MTINEEILAIANQVANEGKKPTVALVKTKLSQPVPLPTIISVLKTWQHDPEFTRFTSAPENKTEAASTEQQQIEQAIARAIEPLTQEITNLKKQLEQLTKKIDPP